MPLCFSTNCKLLTYTRRCSTKYLCEKLKDQRAKSMTDKYTAEFILAEMTHITADMSYRV